MAATETPTTIALSFVMYGESERDSGVARRNQRISVTTEASNMPKDSQKGHAPEPGPRPSIQPMLSSALLAIRPMEHRMVTTAIASSAVRTVIATPAPERSALDRPAPASRIHRAGRA